MRWPFWKEEIQRIEALDTLNSWLTYLFSTYRQATEEPLQEVPRNRQDQGSQEEQELSEQGLILVKNGCGGGNGRGRGLTLLDLIIAVVSVAHTVTPIIMNMTITGRIRETWGSTG